MLKITQDDASHCHSRLQLEGSIAGPWIAELRRLCERVLAEGGTVTLDLSQVLFINSEGVRLVNNLMRRQVAVVGCSPFVVEQLRGAG